MTTTTAGPQLTLTHWGAPPALTHDDWTTQLIKCAATVRACNWWLGDCLNHGERMFGDASEQSLQDTGLSLAHLSRCAKVADRIPAARRHPTLSWTHHHHVADLDPDDQDRLLTLADQEGLTADRLKTRVKVERQARQPRRTSKPKRKLTSVTSG